MLYAGVAVSVAQGLINKLEREGYVRVPMKNKRSGKHSKILSWHVKIY